MLAEYTSHVNMDMECTILFHFPSKRFYQKKKKNPQKDLKKTSALGWYEGSKQEGIPTML